MRSNELRELPVEELDIKLSEAKEELFNLRFQNATGQLENYRRLGQVKRDLARIATVIRERELGIVIEHKDLPPPKPKKEKGSPQDEEPAAEEEAAATEAAETSSAEAAEEATPSPEEVEARLEQIEEEE